MSDVNGRPVNLAGDMIAKLGAAPVVLKGADHRTLLLPEARALGEADDLFRLVPVDGDWRLERRDGAVWRAVPGHEGLKGLHGSVGGLGTGESFVVLASETKRLLVDIHGTLSRTPLGLTYPLPSVTATLPREVALEGPVLGATTLLMTPDGPCSAASLGVGDRVVDRRGRLIAVAGAGAGSAGLIAIGEGALGDGLPASDCAIGAEVGLVFRSELTGRIFGVGEVTVPLRLSASRSGITPQTGEAVALVLEEAAIVSLAGLEIELPGGAAANLPPRAQGRRARRLVADHARTGLPILTPSGLAKAAE